jgi:hypothetical protein
MSIRSACLLAVAAALLVPTAQADILLLKDGRIVDGQTMKQGDGHVLIHFANGLVTVKDELVLTLITEAGDSYEPETEEEKAQFEKGLVPFEGKWIKASKRDKLIAKKVKEKRAEIEDAIAHSEWGNRHIEETSNFRWEFTLPQHVWERYSASLEAYYKIFSKDWRIKRDKRKKKLMINFFGDRKEFQRTSGAPGGALAYFMFLGDYDLCVYYDRLDPDTTEMVLFHEASHYMQKLINPEFRYPHWPGEGLAEYYGGALWDPAKKKLEVGLIQEGRLTEVRSMMSRDEMVTLEDCVKIDAYTDYTWGWTLVHFLMTDKRYEKAFKKYFVGIANAKGVKRTVQSFSLRFIKPEESFRYFKECLGLKSPKDVLELQEEWYSYIRNDLKLESGAGLEKAAISAGREGKSIQAKRLFGEAEAAGGMTANGCHQYAKMLRSKDKAKARLLWEKAISLDPLVGTYYFELGRLTESSDKEEGKRLKNLGRELDPEVDAWSIDFD